MCFKTHSTIVNKECHSNAMTMRGYLVNYYAIIFIHNDTVLEMMTFFKYIQRVMFVPCSIYGVFVLGHV